MRYISTRGEAPAASFNEAIIAGLAPDGGLYLPESWPRLNAAEIAALAGRSYGDLATQIISRFTGGDIAEATLRGLVNEAYSGFRHQAVTPLVQINSNHFLMELFHGPTLAFKDVAMQLLARLMDHVLGERGERATIVGATSGDTGGAAIEAFGGRDRVDIAILFPDGRVSSVQRRQMTTVRRDNVQAIAIEGTFDDAQRLVKSMFADKPFRRRVGLSAVNSINWGRIIAQTVYYFAAATALGAPHRAISFTVPTGNFGNIFAGFVAAKMGLPIKRLVIACNPNDILHRTLAGGRYEVSGVTATSSPSMDIQVSSNFERLIFETAGRDAATVRQLMAGLAQSGAFTLPGDCLEAMRSLFSSGSASEQATGEAMKRTLRQTGVLVDPHTAVGLAVAERLADADYPMVTLATAHPAKFPDAVEAFTGVRPPLPEWTGDLMEREEDYRVLPAELRAIEEAVEDRSRAVNLA